MTLLDLLGGLLTTPGVTHPLLYLEAFVSTDSTRRALRTAFDVIPAVLAALLILVPVLGLSAATVAQVGAVVAAVTVALSKVRNALEDAGLLTPVLGTKPDPEASPSDPAV